MLRETEMRAPSTSELPGAQKLDINDFFHAFKQVQERRFYGPVQPYRYYAILRARTLLELPWYSPQFK